MDEPISNDNPGTVVADNPGTEPAAASNGTVQPGGQANGQTTPADENLGNVNPNSLPPTLKKAYEDMLRDYRDKTMSLAEKVRAETAKNVEAYKQKAEFYDQFVNHPDLVKQYNDYVNRLQQQATAQQEKTGAVDEDLKREIQQIKTDLQVSKTLEYVNAFADAKDDKGQLVHPDFEKFASIKINGDAKGGGIDLLHVAVHLSPGKTPQEKLDNGYKAAAAVYKAIYEEGRKAQAGRNLSKLRNGSLPPSSSAASSTASRRPKNAMEALEFARQGLEVARD